MKILSQLRLRTVAYIPLIPLILIGLCSRTIGLGEYGAQIIISFVAIPTNIIIGLPAFYIFGWKPATPVGQTTYAVLLATANMYFWALLIRFIRRRVNQV
jgi:hypothetical protein